MTADALVRCIEEAAEYGDRFPDQTDADVLYHVSEVCKLSAYLEKDWAVSRAILQAYDHAAQGFIQDEAIDAGIHTAKAYGLIDKGYRHNHYA